MNEASAWGDAQDPLFASYAELARSLVPELTGVALLDATLQGLGRTVGLDSEAVSSAVRQLNWKRNAARPAWLPLGKSASMIALPLYTEDAQLLGVFCLMQQRARSVSETAGAAESIRKSMKPLLDCIFRELVARQPERARVPEETHRTAELEWLFKVTSNLKGAVDDRRVLEELVTAATERMRCALGTLWIPSKRICIKHCGAGDEAEALDAAFDSSKQHLLTWAERQNRPLILNSAGKSGGVTRPCKVLAVPVVRESGAVLGILAFYNASNQADFNSRHSYLARHLGRQVGSVIDSQFDLGTGLYTRGGLQQMYATWEDSRAIERVILYIDVDHMHVVNELLGFEVGNELIVRIADLLAPPLLPEGALAARISADRFAVVMATTGVDSGIEVAERLRVAAKRLTIGPPERGTEVSISCGVAHLFNIPQGLDRAIAAAELACKTAKGRGRDRVEIYTIDDNTMMRSHGDAIAVGELRAALKADRLLLFGQPIVSLANPAVAASYEVLLRIRKEDGTLTSPGPLIDVAARFQLLPTVDRWVTRRALELLTLYRDTLESRGVGMSINVSGQAIGDEVFVEQLAQQIKAARLPAGCITIEITEQAAVANLARANEIIRQLKVLGCRFALDDFGTGSNSLTSLKQLQISRLKIDGSFVRDVLTDRNSEATVRAIVELAGALSIDTVAEYVESVDIADKVRHLGVDYAQGYAFGKPEPLTDILERLSSQESQRMRRLFLES